MTAMRRRVWVAIGVAAALDFTMAWLDWIGVSFVINLPDQSQTIFYGIVAFLLGGYCAIVGRGWHDWSAAPLAALIATTVYTLAGQLNGSFSNREVGGWIILAYVWFETVLALILGAVGIAAGKALMRLPLLRRAT